jgi:AraC-like DNA-binding protein
LFVIESGLMSVETGSGWLMMPPGRIGWVPPGWPHAGQGHGAVESLILYLDPAQSAAMPDVPRVFELSAFGTALLERLKGLDETAEAPRQRLLAVLCDALAEAREAPLHLPMPADRRLLRLTFEVLAAPDDKRTLDEWAEAIGMSRRSLTRHFASETGLSFAQWRTLARLLAALRLLAEDHPVTDVALSLGFDSVSAFIARFRRHFGTTPARYFKEGG